MNIKVINGPNLNMLGVREPATYGSRTMANINEELKKFAKDNNVEISFFQSNCEGAIIDEIQKSYSENITGIIINAGAYTHTSYAIRDAISSVQIATVEVHISNIHAREEFRHTSLIAPVCIGQICGFGEYSYKLAISALISREEFFGL